MDDRMERSQQGMEQLIKNFKSSPIFSKAAVSQKFVMYGAAILFLAALLLVRSTNLLIRPQKARPATPDLKKPATRSFKTPPRKPGGTMHDSEHVALLIYQQFGIRCNSNGQLQLQHPIGMYTPQSQIPTVHSDTVPITSLWDSVIWTGMNG
jgi:hypothetical protein